MKLKRATVAFIVGIAVVGVIGIYFGFDTYNNSKKLADELNRGQALKDLNDGSISIMEYCSHGFTDNYSQKLCTDRGIQK
jgi:hypothetical protein